MAPKYCDLPFQIKVVLQQRSQNLWRKVSKVYLHVYFRAVNPLSQNVNTNCFLKESGDSFYFAKSDFLNVKTVYTFFLIKWILSFDYCEYFDEGMSQKDSRDDSQGPPWPEKKN